MKLKTKLIGGGIALAVIPLIIATVAVELSATNTGNTAIHEQVEQRLISVRDIKKSQIEDYFQTIEKQAITYAGNRMIINAMNKFSDDFSSLKSQTRLDNDNEVRQELGRYYSQQFAQEFKQQNPGEAINTDKLLSSLSPQAVVAQYQYIQNNTHPLGSKHLLDSANDNSDYSKTHAHYHPSIRQYLEAFGYYDIFLVDNDSGHVVYSVYKELDYATSLLTGPYADSGLSQAYRNAQKLNKGEVSMIDFAPYTPSYASAASFMATPIFDGNKRTGVLIFQMPVDEINRIMTHGERWADAGLGASGEVYLIDTHGTMGSNSRFLIEDAEGYFSALKNNGVDSKLLGKIREKQTSIGLQNINTKSAELAVKGQSGVHIINDYRDIAVLSAYAPVTIGGHNWGILAEIDEDEAFYAVEQLSDAILVSAATVALIMTALASGLAPFLALATVKPIIKLADTVEAIERDSDLTRRIEISSNDELGVMSKALNNMLEKFHHSMEQVAGATSQMAAASEEMSNITSETTQAIQSQLGETSQVATAVSEMTATVQEVANSTVSAAGAAQDAQQAANEGNTVVNGTIQAIEELAQAVEQGALTITEVEKNSEAIGTVLQVIQDIAEQTNLLALNAAIEAARAGEHGRGFAVVADEVRTLASRTQDSTEEIKRTIEKLQAGSHGAVAAMHQGRTQAQNSVQKAAEAGQALESIARAVSTIHDMNTQIASAAEEQSAVSEEISRNVEQINSMSQHTAEGANQTSVASEELAKLATDLQTLVKQFRL